MVRTAVLVLIAMFLGLVDVRSQEQVLAQRQSASLSVSSVTDKKAYKVSEQWACTFKATLTAPKEQLRIRAWGQFFADYAVIPEIHGELADTKLSDVLSTGGQIWRDGNPVVLWNAPDARVFGNTTPEVLEAGESATTTFTHNFGAALKAGQFRRKLWFAVVVEPSPGKYMLLFSREPTDVEFTVEGEAIDFDTYLRQRREWDKTRDFKFHDELTLSSNVKEPPE